MYLKFCKDCKFFNRHDRTCEHSKSLTTDLVFGGKEYRLALGFREKEGHSFCGIDAQFFEK